MKPSTWKSTERRDEIESMLVGVTTSRGTIRDQIGESVLCKSPMSHVYPSIPFHISMHAQKPAPVSHGQRTLLRLPDSLDVNSALNHSLKEEVVKFWPLIPDQGQLSGVTYPVSQFSMRLSPSALHGTLHGSILWPGPLPSPSQFPTPQFVFPKSRF